MKTSSNLLQNQSMNFQIKHKLLILVVSFFYMPDVVVSEVQVKREPVAFGIVNGDVVRPIIVNGYAEIGVV